MKQIKIVLIVFGLLATGFGIGFFTHRALVGQHLERVRDLGRDKGFGQQLLRVIQATPEQAAELEPVLHEYGRSIARETRNSRQRRRELIDSMHQEIQPYLTPEQIEQLDEFSRRFRDKRRKKRGPADQKPH